MLYRGSREDRGVRQSPAVSLSGRPVARGALAVVLTYGVGLWVQVLHRASGAHEHHELPLLVHWLRDSSLALPAVLLAVWLVLRAVARTPRSHASTATAIGGATSVVFALGIPVHERLFGEVHGATAELPLPLHLARDLLAAFPMSLTLAAAALYLAAARRGRTATGGRARWSRRLTAAIVALTLLVPTTLVSIGTASRLGAAAAATSPCERTVVAPVVALDQPFMYNRLGAANPAGMIYALRRDVVDKATGTTEAEGATLTAGNVALRPDRRPRPLTLRMNVGDCLRLEFQNLLAAAPVDAEQPATRAASIHVNGLQLLGAVGDDGSAVGRNPSSLVEPGASRTYTLFAEHEGPFLLYNMGATVGAEGSGGTLGLGLFGAIDVEPRGAEWYRSQVTRQEMDLAAPSDTADGHPVIDYDAVYPAGTGGGKDGLPVLRMTRTRADGTLEIVHSDLNAIITGPGRGPFPPGTYPPNPTSGDRNRPFREFTVVFHDEIVARQAFNQFQDPRLRDTLHGVRDGFAINYGAAGAGAEVIANRLGVGPMGDCPECKYEEFFLTSWAVGDPAMVVDVPADTGQNPDGTIAPGPKATKALYPDDPSNVHHSYLNDRVKFRNLHAGPKEHHIFHLHAHQWQATPDDPKSMYLDSQGIGPGAAFTYEIAWGGSGNRNKTIGDAIFHCHFYPHFAQGMWELWRTHDTFERGTVLDADGRPAPGSRALPDGEIVAGTPIPGIVPIPGQAMAPLPGATHIAQQDVNGDGVLDPGGQVVIDEPDANGDGKPDRNVGYPLFVAGVAGHRPPTPPLDMDWDGGLPRHVVTGGTARSTVSPTDFSKELTQVTVRYVPENGTPAERAAMDFHALAAHASVAPDGTAATFATNGLPPAPGAPVADPCRSEAGAPVGVNRTYKAAVIQLDAVLNKAGWHFPQERIEALWQDVANTLTRKRPPEPLVMRLNVGDCAQLLHTNLVPNVYELDDYQVRTPTDIMGQHIHLVKFDVLSADGSGNGFNYEDGTLSPDEVRERITAIRAGNGCAAGDGGTAGTDACPVAQPHPFFGATGPQGQNWLGARTTIQRWYADPLANQSWDRGLGSVFTHDHFGPSTHQQVGLYNTVLIEPEGSTWRDPETGTVLGGRSDGGPTSWKADILTADPTNSHREFFLEFTDFQHAYKPGRGVDANGRPVPDFEGAVNPPGRDEAPNIADLVLFPKTCRNGLRQRPCPEAISADDPGTYVVNYRNEPVGLRVRDPKTGTQAGGANGDLARAFSSTTNRADPAMNVQPTVYPPLTGGVQPGDPYTPLLRAYQGDRVRIRVQAGGDEEGHNITVHGVKWLREPLAADSGWRDSQFAGISEYFVFDLPVIPDPQAAGGTSDFLYTMGASIEDLWNGVWGIMRAYGKPQTNLKALPNNSPIPSTGVRIDNSSQFLDSCPKTAPRRAFDVTAVAARDVLPGGTLVYNSRSSGAGQFQGPLHDPTALLYVATADLVLDPTTGAPVGLKPGTPVEPIILRAAAGDCLEVTLRDKLPATPPDLPGFNTVPPIIQKQLNADGAGGITSFNFNDLRVSNRVGLHPQLLAYDVRRANGVDVGGNPVLSVQPGGSVLYRWYAGDLKVTLQPDGRRIMSATPVEFGAIGLSPADPIKQSGKGLVGAVVIEPKGSTWATDTGTRAQATVTKATGTTFRELVDVWQTDVNLRFGNGDPVPAIAGEGPRGVPEDSEDAGSKAVNYRAEPLWFRLGVSPNTPLTGGHGGLGSLKDLPQDKVFSNDQTGGLDPQTPILTTPAGSEVRLRLVVPGGHERNSVIAVHGHAWPRYPYVNGSTELATTNSTSWWIGSQEGIGPSSHFDLLLASAGGTSRVPGDYLIRDEASFGNLQGLWNLMRVTP